MEEARKVEDISDLERSEYYEPLKTVLYDLLKTETDVGKVVDAALSWLRQEVQIRQSLKRVTD